MRYMITAGVHRHCRCAITGWRNWLHRRRPTSIETRLDDLRVKLRTAEITAHRFGCFVRIRRYFYTEMRYINLRFTYFLTYLRNESDILNFISAWRQQPEHTNGW